MNILVTGARGFIGKNLIAALKQQPDRRVLEFDLDNSPSDLVGLVAEADWVFHLAGVNRPHDEGEFQTGNVDLTVQLCDLLATQPHPARLVLASSIQAELDNPYGRSKRQAEMVVAQYAAQTGARAIIYRLKNVFGKWCRPNYNSVVATFCHSLARDLPITISDPNKVLDLIHIDDVVTHWLADLINNPTPALHPQRGASVGGAAPDEPPNGPLTYREVTPAYTVTLGQLADLIRSFRQIRQTLHVPDLSDEFTRKLHGTYLSYLPTDQFAYDLEKRSDPRGCLAEFVKSAPFGQIFVSRTLPGITRGNHYHHTKTEKFLVLQGEALIRFRQLSSGEVIEYPVRGEDFRVVDIPPGYTHSIENTGTGELVTLFWSSEIFDLARPDTYGLPVLGEGKS
jgi:UDP-2-acetamido-2,6-beta-L-arabino-hexul-4-ose reductase